MGKHAGMYKSEKRKKELARQKKQEEKRQKRLSKMAEGEQPGEESVAGEGEKAESTEGAESA